MTGYANDLGRRVPQHKDGTGSRFTARYGVQRLVWYKEHFDIRDAIQREKSLKSTRRRFAPAPPWDDEGRGCVSANRKESGIRHWSLR
jgi:hypothetical protein